MPTLDWIGKDAVIRHHKEVPGLGSGFQFCRLSAEPLFNEFGDIRDDVTFAELADFVWFAETGVGYVEGRDGSPNRPSEDKPERTGGHPPRLRRAATGKHCLQANAVCN